MKTAIKITFLNFRKWIWNPRIYILAAIIGGSLISRVQVLLESSEKYGYAVNILSLLPMVMGGKLGFSRFLCMFGAVLLFCDAPFMDDNQQFVFIRAGRKRWMTGSVSYILSASFFYVLYIWSALILGVFPNIGISVNWGTLAENIALTQEINTISFTEKTILHYKAPEAFFYMFFSMWMSVAIIGMIMYIVNLFLIRRAGVMAGSMVVILNGIALYLPEKMRMTLFYVSPVSLQELWCLNADGKGAYPSVQYALCFYVLVIMILVLIIFCSFRRVNMEIQERI